MLTSPVIISLIYYIAFLIYPLLGIYVLSLNKKAEMNQVFFLLSLSLGIWALGFALAVNAPTYAQALAWRRFSSLGWGTAYAFQLHFALVLTERKKILQYKWLRPLLYLPALISIIGFGPFTRLAEHNYLLEWTENGWVSLFINTPWDWIFNAYYAIYALAAIATFFFWGRVSKESSRKKTANLIGLSFLTIILLGTFVDVLEYGSLVIPDISVLIIMFPLTALYYSIRKHGILMSKQVQLLAPEGEILGESKRQELYKYISVAFVIGSLLNLGHYFAFPDVDLIGVLLYGVILYLIAVLFRATPLLPVAKTVQDNIMVMLLVIAIPIIMLRFLNIYGSNIVWPVPLIFMSLGAIYSKKRVIIATSITAIATQIFSWISAPILTVQITPVDHILRFIFFVLGAALTLYINQTYVFRLKENEEQIHFQNMISHISTGLIRVNSKEIDSRLTETLKLCADYFQADRSYLFLLSKNSRNMSSKHNWKSAIAAAAPELSSESAAEIIFHLTANNESYAPLRINDATHLNKNNAKYKHILEELQAQSVIIAPVMNKTGIIGFWWLDTINRPGKWTDDYSKQIMVIANILADTLVKAGAEQEIYKMALYDELTGLPNRSLFNTHMENAISLAERTNELICIMFIDLDAFKQINDTMGHNYGDRLLQQVAKRLHTNIRKYDTICRFGGDEFLIMLPQMKDLQHIQQAANKIMAAFNEPAVLNNQEIFVTASAGLAIYPHDGSSIDVLVKNADLAMYTAKERGKNQYAFYSDLMESRIQQSMRLTNQLYRAIERQELLLHYQPQISLDSNKIVGTEALLRWQHPEQGMVSPATFIPLAESTGLINPIGLWVLRTACRQNRKWQILGAADLKIAVNVSVQQLRSKDFVSQLAEILNATDLEPEYLELEITESVFTKDPEYITDVLFTIKQLGVNISIDDFGTEYSSLSRLKEMPVDKLKIDLQFVQGLETDPKDRAITSIITSLSKNLNMTATAEGVETAEQLSYLRQLDCDEAQGYYFHKPLPTSEAEELILMDAAAST